MSSTSSSSSKRTNKSKTKDLTEEDFKEGFDRKLLEAIKHYDTLYVIFGSIIYFYN
jgi:hypothetical protein